MIDFLAGVPGKLKTLIDRLTSTRAANLDNLDAAISSRAPSSTALSTATWTGARAGYLDNLASGIPTSMIQSIQKGTISLSSVQTSNTATITSVTTSKALVLLTGVSTDATSPDAASVRITLTNATTVTANRNAHGSASSTIGFVVIEFK